MADMIENGPNRSIKFDKFTFYLPDDYVFVIRGCYINEQTKVIEPLKEDWFFGVRKVNQPGVETDC